MKKPIGISLEIGRDEKGWFVYLGKQKMLHIRPTRNNTNARYGGLKIDLSFGTVKRPLPKIYKREYWSKEYMVREPATNPWNSGNHWFVLSIPIPVPTFFVSLCYGAGKRQPGFYFGFKTYEVNAISQGLGRYNVGQPEKVLAKAPYPANVAWGGIKDVGNIYLAFSFSIRKDLVD